jgi:hypothetical protein
MRNPEVEAACICIDQMKLESEPVNVEKPDENNEKS